MRVMFYSFYLRLCAYWVKFWPYAPTLPPWLFDMLEGDIIKVQAILSLSLVCWFAHWFTLNSILRKLSLIPWHVNDWFIGICWIKEFGMTKSPLCLNWLIHVFSFYSTWRSLRALGDSEITLKGWNFPCPCIQLDYHFEAH